MPRPTTRDRAAALAGRTARALATATRRYGFDAAGLTLLSTAAWTWTTTAGLAAAGISCLIMQWRVRGT